MYVGLCFMLYIYILRIYYYFLNCANVVVLKYVESILIGTDCGQEAKYFLSYYGE